MRKIILIILMGLNLYGGERRDPIGEDARMAAYYKIMINTNCSGYGLTAERLEKEARNLNKSNLTLYRIKYQSKCLKWRLK